MFLSRCMLIRVLKSNVKYLSSRFFSSNEKKPPWNVLFFGSDEFSMYSLKALTREYRKGTIIKKLEVVTTIKGKSNPVKLYSEKEHLNLHKWVPDLVYGQFDVGLVVSFGHLIPGRIIEQFEFGILNVHASLLPRWRGAAPIIYAIANGDTQTGITIMKINPDKFDTGEIVHQESVPIQHSTRMFELHRILGEKGAKNLVVTLESLPLSLKHAKPQPTEGVTYAPRVKPELTYVKWNRMTSDEIFNLARALDGLYHLQTTWNDTPIKLINVTKADWDTIAYKANPGFVKYDKDKNVLKILCSDSKVIAVENVSVLGKRTMSSKDFNNGYIKKEPFDCRYFK